jgi:hypothetical protein
MLTRLVPFGSRLVRTDLVWFVSIRGMGFVFGAGLVATGGKVMSLIASSCLDFVLEGQS